MKLYLIGEQGVFLHHWQNAFHALYPSTFFSLEELSPEFSGVAFVIDTLLLDSSAWRMTDYPNLKFMVLSGVPDFNQAQFFLQNNAMGYGNAMMHESHLHSAFQTLGEGKVWLYPDFTTLLITQMQVRNAHEETASHRLDVLSPREREVALLLNEGKSHLEISDELQITVRTIKAHSAAIYEKMGVKDRLALSLFLHS
uniref:HTH luxR-type domain-containing protein n=1 Tax=uncultured bacterium pL TaxID=1781163 RepID=A0A1C9U593_9BACT|nr:hypothetical protein [uncultured bacterium pL]